VIRATWPSRSTTGWIVGDERDMMDCAAARPLREGRCGSRARARTEPLRRAHQRSAGHALALHRSARSVGRRIISPPPWGWAPLSPASTSADIAQKNLPKSPTRKVTAKDHSDICPFAARFCTHNGYHQWMT
jgi:hypothetical protein